MKQLRDTSISGVVFLFKYIFISCNVISCHFFKLFFVNTFVNFLTFLVYPGSDAIIKQHKAACLRVTALLTCKDLLWIGTSAGVVLTLPLPLIAPNTTSVQTPLDVTASAQGHTGHVRFLTAVEIGKPDEKDESTSNTSVSRSPRRTAINIDGKSKMAFPGESILIISGGDGYEDFKSSASESAGREDSTNHLLIWKV